MIRIGREIQCLPYAGFFCYEDIATLWLTRPRGPSKWNCNAFHCKITVCSTTPLFLHFPGRLALPSALITNVNNPSFSGGFSRVGLVKRRGLDQCGLGQRGGETRGRYLQRVRGRAAADTTWEFWRWPSPYWRCWLLPPLQSPGHETLIHCADSDSFLNAPFPQICTLRKCKKNEEKYMQSSGHQKNTLICFTFTVVILTAF